MPKYYIVDGDLLPDVFLKALKANELLKSSQCKTINQAIESANLSRSAFYKYRDAIRPFYEMETDRIITLHVLVNDRAGILSCIINLLAQLGTNILTINQNIPINGQASVTLSVRTEKMQTSLEDLISMASCIDGVIKLEILS